MANILFLFEGAITEHNYYKVIEKVFKDRIKSKVDFYCYKTNIHTLYDEINADESLNIIDLVKEKAKKVNDLKNYRMLDETKFGEIYLIFDLDPQDERFNCKRIREMLDLFDNETEHGKLYINYPMIESFKHFKTIPDEEYNSYKIKIKDCLTYKRDVAKLSCINDYKKIDRNKYFYIIKQNLNKVNLLINNNTGEYDYDTYKNTINQTNMFNIQEKEIMTNKSVYILNTLCLWPLDYLGEGIFSEIFEKIEKK